mmetsp:Transcript_16124/g.37035  ORF Transcript_16124/g.37035 Transcript_16124/m.37035 type:complete len:263 (-) Transcript_16124:364-1152(-)
MTSTLAAAALRSTSSMDWSMNTPTTKGVLLHACRNAAHLFRKCSWSEHPGQDGAVTASTRSPNLRTTSTILKACEEEAWRFDSAKMTPIKLAPAEIAQVASFGLVTPQTLTSTAPGATGNTVSVCEPIISKIAEPGSAARINASPTSTPLQPMALHCTTSSAVDKPLNASTFNAAPLPYDMLKVCFSSLATAAVLFLSNSKVCKSRLLTPITLASASKATFSSRKVTTSTIGSKPYDRQHATSDLKRDCRKIDTIRRIVSAP